MKPPSSDADVSTTLLSAVAMDRDFVRCEKKLLGYIHADVTESKGYIGINRPGGIAMPFLFPSSDY